MLKNIHALTGHEIVENQVLYIDLNKDFPKNTFEPYICITTKCNDVIQLQEKLQNLNAYLQANQTVIVGFETLKARLNRIEKNSFKLLATLIVINEFILLRLLPRLFLFKWVYTILFRGKFKILSKAEGLGRMAYAGFTIRQIKSLNSILYAELKKSKEPKNQSKPSYGPLFKMTRLGKNKRKIGVYKIRTMHPYSEYLQDFMIKNSGYSEKGKLNNDFRVTIWGKWMRKYYLDELPQIINVLKGEMKLLGLRPLSEAYFNGLSIDYQNERLKYKPGCIPPYVALNYKSSKEEVIKAEKKYIELKSNKPYTTDLILFFKALRNLLIYKVRSS